MEPIRECENIKEQPDENQGRSFVFGRRIFKPLLEYRQLPILSPFKLRKVRNEPLTLGQLYKNDFIVSASVAKNCETSSESEDDDRLAECECTQRNKISMRSLQSCDNFFDGDEDSFERKLNAHAKSFQSKPFAPLHLSIMFDNRVGEFV